MSSSQSFPREEPSQLKPARKLLLALVRLGIGIGLVAYLARSGIINLRALANLFTAWPVTLAAIALLLFDVSMMALRLTWLFRPQGLHLSLRMSLQLTLVGFFFATFLPGSAGGDIAKLFYATRENSGRKTEIITIVILDRVVGIFSMLLLPLLFAPLFPRLIHSIPILRYLLTTVALLAAGLLASFLLILWNQSIFNLLGQKAFGLSRWETVVFRGLETIRTYRHTWGTLLAALGASLLANLSLIGVTALGMLTVNPSGLAMKMCLVIPMGYIVNSLPLTPGGLGVGEIAFDALFVLAGLPAGAETLLCWRIWSAMVGILGLIVYLRGMRRSIINTAEAQ